jgi:4-amino-4-deoxy-L-arabinose transferase-like glycosyltransferase
MTRIRHFLATNWAPVLCIALGHLALSVIQLCQLRADPFFAAPTGDAGHYLKLGLAVAAGQPLSEGPLFYAPVMPLLHAGLTALFGRGPWPYQILATIAGLALTVMICLTALRLVGRAAAWIAGAAWILFPTVLFFQAEPVFALWAALAVIGVFQLLDGPRRPLLRAALAGGLIGLSGQGQTNLLVLAPLCAVWLLLEGRQASRLKRPLMSALVLLLATLALSLPATLYNRTKGSSSLFRTAGGINFYVGNDLGSAGVFHFPRGFGGGVSHGQFPETSRRVASTRAGRQLTMDEASSFFYAQGLRELGQRGIIGTLFLYMKKAYILLCAEEVPIHRDQEFASQWASVRRVLPVNHAHLLGFSLLALPFLLGQRRGRLILLLASGVLLSVLPFFVNDRLRFPATSLLAVMAGAGICQLVGSMRTAPRRAGIGLAIALAVIGLLHLPAPIPHRNRIIALEWERLGATWANRGQHAAAARALDRCLHLQADHQNRRWMRARMAFLQKDHVAGCTLLRPLVRGSSPRAEWVRSWQRRCGGSFKR